MEQSIYKNSIAIISIIVVLFVIAIGVTVFFKQDSKSPITSTVDQSQNLEVTGTYMCLPQNTTTGVGSAPCVVGIQSTDGVYYVLDFAQITTQQTALLVTGDRITVSGSFVPKEALSSTYLQAYPATGIIRVAALRAIDRTVVFACPTQSIAATFHLVGDETVDLSISDGRTVTLAHAISASGARYATSDERIVFWTKGATAFMIENGVQTIGDCVAKDFAQKD